MVVLVVIVITLYYRKIHYLTREFHIKFHMKNQYLTHCDVMSTIIISVSKVKINMEFKRRVMNFP